MVVLCVVLLHDEKTRVHIIDGSGKRSRVYKLLDITVDEEVSDALIGLYAFTGNDFVSSLFGIGKVKAYKQMMSDRKHLNLFSGLGESRLRSSWNGRRPLCANFTLKSSATR